ncbi:MAG: AbrB/MazE/SpoVT family DNA-binding domain-containing protein [Patescibacteria group bacterium]
MTHTTTMTQKGQITVPQYIRKALHVDRDSKFLITLDEAGGLVILKPIVDLLSLAGSLKSSVVLTDKQLRDARVASWGSRLK